MQKKIMSAALAVIMVLSLATSALAATPRWSFTDRCNVALSFSGSTAGCDVVINGSAGVNKISATVMLQKDNGGSYTTVKTWNETVYSAKYTLDATYSGCTKGDYRLYVSATVYNSNGQSEVVSNYATCRY